MSKGARIQLHALGPQDYSLYIDPSKAIHRPFSTCPKRHTRFALETRRDPFPDPFVLGATNTYTIPRAGDLLGDLFLEITLPAIPGASSTDLWVDSVGYVLLRKVTLTVDDTVIHNHERLWYDLDDALFGHSGHVQGLNELIGRGVQLPMNEQHTLIIPLKCFFCKGHRADQQFLPLLGIPGSTIKLSIEAESLTNLVAQSNPNLFVPGVMIPLPLQFPPPPPTSFDAHMISDYVFVDASEKERILSRPTSILYDDVQDVEAPSFTESTDVLGGAHTATDTVKVNMREVNAPVKMLAWVVYGSQDLANKLYFQYRNVIREVDLTLDSVSFFERRPTDFFSTMQQYYHVRTMNDSRPIHVFSFALDASSWQPTGQCNFDQIASPELKCYLTEKRTDLIVKVFVMAYKQLVFYKGRLVLKYI